jgi:hypothetical protein
MSNDPGDRIDCDTAREEYSRGYTTGMADGYDDLPPETGDEHSWYDQGYRDGYDEMSKE